MYQACETDREGVFLEVTAAGSQIDIREGTNLLETVPFFRSRVEVDRFITQALSLVVSSLPMRLSYVDFGGGQGFLTRYIRNDLVARGHNVTATVADSNVQFLLEAQRANLNVVPVNLEQSSFTNVDLITMRLVNHYNPAQTQQAIMAAAFSALKLGGYFICQIETGSLASCHLRNELAELYVGNSRQDAHYCWVPEEEYRAWLRKTGFEVMDVQVATCQHESSVASIVKLAWERLHGGEYAHASTSDDTTSNVLKAIRNRELTEVNSIVDAHWRRYGDDSDGVYRRGNGFMLRTSCPFIICRKSCNTENN